MTIFAALADAFTAFDRSMSQRRGGLLSRVVGGSTDPLVVPVPMSEPIQLAAKNGRTLLVTYADSVGSIPVIFGVWSKLVRNLSTTDIEIVRDRGDGRRPEPVYGTDVERLLREPAEGKGLVDLLQWWFNPLKVEGNGLVAKYRGAGEDRPPTNLIPLDWRYLSAWAIPGGPVEWWISHQLGEARAIAPREVVHAAWQAPTGSDIGMSPLQALGTAIRLEDSAQRYQVASFDNAARPGGAIVFPKDAEVTDDMRAAMRAEVRRLHQGIDRAFSVAVLYGGLDWRPMSFSAVEAELLGTRDRSRQDVYIAFDIRKSVIEETESGAKAAVQEILRDFQRSLRPDTDLVAGAIQRQLIDAEPEWYEERYRLRFRIGDLVRGTRREEVETSVHAYTNGLASLNESRGEIGYGEVDPNAAPDDQPRTPYAQLEPGRDGRTLAPSDETDPSRLTRPAAPASGH